MPPARRVRFVPLPATLPARRVRFLHLAINKLRDMMPFLFGLVVSMIMGVLVAAIGCLMFAVLTRGPRALWPSS